MNELSNNKKYIKKSDINGKFIKKYKMKDFYTVDEVKKEFKKCVNKKIDVTGNEYNSNQQRRTTYVEVDELLFRLTHGISHIDRDN